MIAVKVSLNGDLRRFALESSSSLETLLSKIRQLYNIPQNENIIVHYEDDEKDRITIGSDAELREAINLNTTMSKSTQQPTLRLFADVKPGHHGISQPQSNATTFQPKPSIRSSVTNEEPASFINFAQTMGFNNTNFNQLFNPLLPQFLTLLNNVNTQQQDKTSNANNTQPNFNQLLMNPQLFSLFGQFIGTMPREQLFAVMHQLLANPVLSQAASSMLANFAAMAQQTQTQQNSSPASTKTTTTVPTPPQQAPSSPSQPVQPPQPAPEVLNAAFVEDVTFPDGTVVQQQQEFVKVWKLKNNGNNVWPKGVKLDYVSGDLQATHIEPLAEAVAPGQVVEVKATFTAPCAPGKHSSFWKMASNSGQYGASIWVDIVVPEKKSEPEQTPQHPVEVPSQPEQLAQEPQGGESDDAVKYAKALTQLNEMGFHDDRLNLALLLESNGDLLRVVQELLNLEMNK